jgi:hypothetical protein
MGQKYGSNKYSAEVKSSCWFQKPIHLAQFRLSRQKPVNCDTLKTTFVHEESPKIQITFAP